MLIKAKNHIPNREELYALIVHRLKQAVETSRFRADIRVESHGRWGRHVRIDRVQLRRRKHYCGQHPNECVNSFKKERSGLWLEGADWVGWNDGLNDLLDNLEADVDVWSFNQEASPSGRYFIRKGLCRRVEYASEPIDRGFVVFYSWQRDGRHENWVGREAPRSEYPEGTPGIACWTLRDESRLSESVLAH